MVQIDPKPSVMLAEVELTIIVLKKKQTIKTISINFLYQQLDITFGNLEVNSKRRYKLCKELPQLQFWGLSQLFLSKA